MVLDKAKTINKLALGNVISALANGNVRTHHFFYYNYENNAF
jgi:hypothetical protein